MREDDILTYATRSNGQMLNLNANVNLTAQFPESGLHTNEQSHEIIVARFSLQCFRMN